MCRNQSQLIINQTHAPHSPLGFIGMRSLISSTFPFVCAKVESRPNYRSNNNWFIALMHLMTINSMSNHLLNIPYCPSPFTFAAKIRLYEQ